MMAVIEIKDESQLPGPPEFRRVGDEAISNVGARNYYVRSLCDPRFYIEGATGTVYTRKDGQNWKHPAVKLERVAVNDTRSKVNRMIAGAWGDHIIYDYAEKK